MEDLLTFALLGAYLLMIALDFLTPARHFPRLRRWRLKGLAFTVVYVSLSIALPLFWDAHFAEHRLIDATGLGIGWGAVIGLLALELGIYAWHRLMHRVGFLWRWFHQMHHSAERVDVFGAFYFSPLDMLAFTLVTSLSLVLVVGVSAGAAVIASTIATFIGFFNHSNIRTPRWLGYVIQRPENHALHHERGVHAYNYGDISLWDQIFGTFRNPTSWDGVGGFYDGASTRIGDMLLGRDVSTPPEIPSVGQPRPVVRGAAWRSS